MRLASMITLKVPRDPAVPRCPSREGSRLAAALGYADSAHFIRDFKRLVSRTPVDYARSFAAFPPGRV